MAASVSDSYFSLTGGARLFCFFGVRLTPFGRHDIFEKTGCGVIRVLYDDIVRAFKETGSIKKVAERLGTYPVKVRRVLITEGLWSSPTSSSVGGFAREGLSVKEIAVRLNMSEKSVQSYLPYSRGVYGDGGTSADAVKSRNYRERKKAARAATEAAGGPAAKGRGIFSGSGAEQEVKAYRLLLELDTEDLDEDNFDVLRRFGKVKAGITREVVVPAWFTLHALHYVIQRLFGWQNNHLHHFGLPRKLFDELTGDNFYAWSSLCGVYFRFPTDDLEDVYWDDNYDGDMSFRDWLRSKYEGRHEYGGVGEYFLEAQCSVSEFMAENGRIRVPLSFLEWQALDPAERKAQHGRIKTIRELACSDTLELFDNGTIYELLERLPLSEIVQAGQELPDLTLVRAMAQRRFKEYIGRYMKALGGKVEALRRLLREADGRALPLTDRLEYEYDYGDGWRVQIKVLEEYRDESDKTVKRVLEKQRPVCTAADGLPVLDDVGGLPGYCDMLRQLNGVKLEEEYPSESPDMVKSWARSLGWTGCMKRL